MTSCRPPVRRAPGKPKQGAPGFSRGRLAIGLCVPLLLPVSCTDRGPEVLGVFEGAVDPLPVPQALEEAEELLDRERVIIQGEISEVCPTAGCWLVLRDGDRSLRVDLLGFSASRGHQGRSCRLEGKLARKQGRLTLLARGARFDP